MPKMKSRSLMGSNEAESNCHWTESLLFDNCCQEYPVEMFVELMAEECKNDRLSDDEICRRAIQHLPPDLAQPFKERLEDGGETNVVGISERLTWDSMRSDLVHSFTHRNFSDDNYKLELLQSLTKGRREKATTFLGRVKFVATVIEHGKWEPAHPKPSSSWVRILFLNGLTANECYSLLGQYGLTDPEEMATYIQCHVKVEEEDFGEVRVKREDLKNPAAASSSIPDSAMAALTNPDLLYPIMADDDFMGAVEAAPAAASRDLAEAADERSDAGGDVADHVTDEDGDFKAEQGEEEDEEELPLRQRRKKRKKAERTRGSKDKKAPPPPPPTFDCEICRKSFRGSVLLANHVANVHQTHPSATEGNVDIKEVKAELFSRLGADRDLEEGQVFPCKVCSVVLKTQANLEKHLKSAHSNTSCSVCCQEFDTKEDWTRHCDAAHAGNRARCKICDALFKSQSQLDKHCTEKHEGRKFKCHICQKEILAQRAFDKHMKLLHSDPTKAIPKHMLKAQTNYHKPLSQEEFLTGNYPYKGLYMQVIKARTQGGKKTYVCALCEAKVEGHKEFFNGHVKGVHNGHIARCDVCDFTSQVWLRVVSHRLKKHNLTTEGFKVINCPKEGCQFKTVQEVELEKHTEAVHDKIKFQCDHCQKWLSTKGALKLHVENVHLGWKRFACEICGLSFKSERYQQIHMERKHLNIIPERKMCDECGSTFIDKAALNRHISVHHSGAPSQKCMHCDKSFYHRAGLLSHIRTVHQMDKSFYCSKCSRAFSSGFKLRMHIATFHLNMKPFRCTLCNSSFPKSSNLCYHIGTSHMGLTLADARKSCKAAKAHKAYEYTKPDEALFEPYKPFDLKEQSQLQQQQVQQQQQQQQLQQLHSNQQLQQVQQVQQITTGL